MTMERIEGIHADIKAAELKELIATRVAYHEERAERYADQLARLEGIDKEMAEQADEISKYANSTTAAQTMRGTIRSHRNNVTYFRFLGEHLVPDAVYRLSETDLTTLGVRGF